MNRSRISVCHLAAVMLVVTAAFIPPRAQAMEDYTAPRNSDVDARGARSARIEASSGILRVEGQPGITQVRVRGTAHAGRKSRLDDIRLVAERRGDVVFIKADLPQNRNGFWAMVNGEGHNMALDLVIEVPSSLALDVDDGSGEAEFRNTGSLTLEDGSGNIDIRSANGSVRIDDGSGNIAIDGVEGSVKVVDGSGEIRGTNITGDFIVSSDGSGNIDARGIGGTMRVENDGSGNIDVGRVAGDFVVDSDGSGSIRYETVKGNVRIPDRKRRGGY